MTQEVRVMLILEVDASKDTEEIKQGIVDIFAYPDIGIDLITIAELREESDIYESEIEG